MTSDILTQFVTVFLGAFLAFWLENVREKRQLQSQLNAYIRHFTKSLEESLASQREFRNTSQKILNVYEKLIETDHAPSDEDWKALPAKFTVSTSDASLIYSGNSLSVLPPDVVNIFETREEQFKEMKSRYDDYRALYVDYAVPIIIRKPNMLEEADKRALNLIKAQLEVFFTSYSTFLETIPETLELFKKHGYR